MPARAKLLRGQDTSSSQGNTREGEKERKNAKQSIRGEVKVNAEKGTEGGGLLVGLAKAKRTLRNCTRERMGEVEEQQKEQEYEYRQRTSYGDR